MQLECCLVSNKGPSSPWRVPTWEATGRQLIFPPSTIDFLVEVGLSLSLGWLLTVKVKRLHVGDLRAVDWG